MANLLDVKNLTVCFGDNNHKVGVVEDVSFTVAKGETLGIVGESGSGKSVTSLAIMRLLPENTAQVTGNVYFAGNDILCANEKQMQSIRGNKISMIFQEPMTSLNPLHTCGRQVMEPLLLHTDMNKKKAREKAIELFNYCGIPDPYQRFHEYPHQLSGGMRQRIMIAIALSCSPGLLIADEPTTALDVTIQAQIMDLMKSLKNKMQMSMLLITHDLGVVVDACDRVVIMYAGQLVESAPVTELFEQPRHPYTRGLIDAMPLLKEKKNRLNAIEGMVPDIGQMPQGCRFNPRCKNAGERCKEQMPALKTNSPGRLVRCFLYEQGGVNF